MNKKLKNNKFKNTTEFGLKVEKKVKRKLKARDNPTSVWLGLSTMGLIGWSVAVPTLLGVVIGSWLDKRYSSNHSWTLALLVAGLAIGCAHIWHWMSKEHHEMHQEQEKEIE